MRFLLILMTLTALGCSTNRALLTSNALKKSYETVDLSDGVNKKEALILARYYLINKKDFKDREVPDISRVVSNSNYKQTQYYCVRFRFIDDSKIIVLHPFTYDVHVDAQTGEITDKSSSFHK